MAGSVRVGVVDDHPSIVAAIAAAIGATEDLRLEGTARTLEDGIELLARVDVLLCDVQLEGGAEGLQILAAAAEVPSKPAVLLLSGFGHHSVLRAALERGAAGFVDKGTEVEGIVEAIRTVAAGGTVFRASDLAAARQARTPPTARELHVIEAVIGGATNAEVAAHLGLSEKTVETHLHRLFDRYGLVSRTELAVLAVNERWVSQDPGAAR